MKSSRVACLALAATLTSLSDFAVPLRAQARDVAAVPDALKRRIEETWRVVPLQDGILLVPRRASVRAKGIELSQGGIGLDGRVVTGAELVERLGADAEPVLQLSYLAPDRRAALFADIPAVPVERPTVEGDAGQERREAEAAAGEISFRQGPRGARVRVFGDVKVSEGERVGDAVAVFGSVDMQGTATGDVVAVFGDVALGPKASVGGSIAAVGGRLRQADGATTVGKLTEVRIGWPEMSITVPGDDQFSLQVTPDWPRLARVQWVSGLVGVVLMLVVCLFTALVAPGPVTAAARPGRSILLSGFVGAAIQVMFLPVVALVAAALTVSVIGIPLLAGIPVLFLALAVASVVGFTGLAARIGSGWRPSGQVSAPVTPVLIGLAVIWAVSLTGRYLWFASNGTSAWAAALAVVGLGIEYACWTIGLGAAALAWKARRAPRTVTTPVMAPPPVPVDL